jgi:hypothetical protein
MAHGFFLTLALLKARILFVNDVQLALSADDLAIDTAFFY